MISLLFHRFDLAWTWACWLLGFVATGRAFRG